MTKLSRRHLLASAGVFAAARLAAASGPKPLLSTPTGVHLKENFDGAGELDRTLWRPSQHTRWDVKDGMLHGMPSTDEYQRSRNDHQGFEPRLMVRTALRDYAVEFRFRVNSGEQHMVGAFFEIGHHYGRLAFKESGLEINLGDLRNPTILAHRPDIKIQRGHWYHVLAEQVGDEMLVQFVGGPTLYGQHPELAKHTDNLGITGLRGGTMDIDEFTMWTVEPKPPAGWPAARAKLKAGKATD